MALLCVESLPHRHVLSGQISQTALQQRCSQSSHTFLNVSGDMTFTKTISPRTSGHCRTHTKILITVTMAQQSLLTYHRFTTFSAH